MTDIMILAELIGYLWESNRAAILYVLWLIQTWWMLGAIVK
jgi:hypothetical protein